MMNIIMTYYKNSNQSEQSIHSGQEVINQLPDVIKGYEIRKVPLPMMFDDNFRTLEKYIDDSTKGIVSLGSVPIDCFALERVALNLKNANGKDENGYSPTDETIAEDGRNAYFSSLPLRQIEDRLNRMGVPAVISNTAGLSLCNNIMYHTGYYQEKQQLEYLYGFIHIPSIADEAKSGEVKTMELEIIQKGIDLVLDEVIQWIK